MNKETGQDKDDAGPGHVPAEIGCKTGYDSTQDTVVRVTEQTTAGSRRFAVSLLARGGCVFLLPVVQLFGLAHTGNDLFHLFYRNHLQAAAQGFVKQFGDAGFHVAHNLIRPFFLAEMIAKVIQIIIQQDIGILINVIYGAS